MNKSEPDPTSPTPKKRGMTPGSRQMNDVDRVISSRIAVRRQAVGFTQADLARKIGISFQQVQKYEKGQNRVAAGVLFKIAQALGVSPNYFYQGAGDSDKVEPITPVERMIEQGGSRIIDDYLTLPPPKRAMLATLARALAIDEKAHAPNGGREPS